MGEGVEIGIGVQLDGPAFIGDEVKLKAGAHINEHGVIDRYSVIDDNTKVSNSVVWPHSYIGERCRLRQAIVCRNVTIKNDSLLEENSVIADECVLGRGSQIRAGVKIWPSKTVEPGSTVNESVIWAGEWRSGLFSSYGLGGLINVELTPEFCARLGAAFGATLSKGACVVVGQDHARSSRMIKRAIVSGIVSAGAKARDVRELPVPVTQWATLDAECSAGIHVLVSPLDQRSADIRFFDSEGLQIDKRAERKLENLLFREDFRRAGFYEMGDIEYGEPIPGYIKHLFETVDADVIRNAGFRVLIDYDYSDASAVLPMILNELGVTTIPLNAGMREGEHHRTVPDETALISKTVRADVGCMISPTGERITIIDDKGVVLSPHECLGLLASWWVRSNPGTVLAPAATPMWISDLVRKEGGTFSSTPGRSGVSAARVDDVGNEHRLGRRGRLRVAGSPRRLRRHVHAGETARAAGAGRGDVEPGSGGAAAGRVRHRDRVLPVGGEGTRDADPARSPSHRLGGSRRRHQGLRRRRIRARASGSRRARVPRDRECRRPGAWTSACRRVSRRRCVRPRGPTACTPRWRRPRGPSREGGGGSSD